MSYKQIEVEASNSKKLNGYTITAIVMAAVSILIDPFSILSILGIIFGGVGLAKAHNSKDKTWAMVSLGLSITETVIWAVVFASALAAL